MSAKKQSIQISFILFLLIFLFITLVLTASVTDGLKDRIKKAKSFDDIFKLEKTIRLEPVKKTLITGIPNLLVTSEGDMVIRIEGAGPSKVLVYDQQGNYKKSIGKSGYTAEEYLAPNSITKDSRDNIYILDQVRRKILVFDLESNLIDNIPYNSGGLYISINSKDEIFSYSGINTRKKENCIYKFTTAGKTITEFCGFPEEITDMKFAAIYNTMAIDKMDFVYEVNSLWSNVRKYNSDGIFLTEFGGKKAEMINSRNKKGKVVVFPKLVTGIYIHDDMLLVVYDNDKMDIYGLDGEVLYKNIKMDKDIISSSDGGIYISNITDDTKPVILKYVLKD